MDNPEYMFQILEVFSKIKTKEIPRELEEYLSYVARTGDLVFQWSLVKVLVKEKLLAVLEEFMEGNPNLEIPPCPNVDPFNFETMKNNLLNRLDSFLSPPFTIQRICELLSTPRKEYNRLDKYMRAIEKNVLVVSSGDLSSKRANDADSNDSVINGILYEKVNDSLNNVSNHVFSGEESDGEMNVGSKLDETDAVQQMIEESWTDDNHDEFKLNGGRSSSSTIGVNFENELQFVTDRTCEEKNLSNASDKEDGDSTFDSNSMLLDSSLQNIIGESGNIAFENVSKSEESFDLKNDDTYEFRSDSICESEPSSTSETEVEATSDSKIEDVSPVKLEDDKVSSTMEEVDSGALADTAGEHKKPEPNAECAVTKEKTEVVSECHQLETNTEYDTSNSYGGCENEDPLSTINKSEENNQLAVVQNVFNQDVEVENSSNRSVSVSQENQSLELKNVDCSNMEVDEAEPGLSCGDIEQTQDTEESVPRETEIDKT